MPDPPPIRRNVPRRAWLHDAVQVAARYEEFARILKRQFRAIIAGTPPACACCGNAPGWRFLYRCYQCDLWLCLACAPVHWPEVRRV